MFGKGKMIEVDEYGDKTDLSTDDEEEPETADE